MNAVWNVARTRVVKASKIKEIMLSDNGNGTYNVTAYMSEYDYMSIGQRLTKAEAEELADKTMS